MSFLFLFAFSYRTTKPQDVCIDRKERFFYDRQKELLRRIIMATKRIDHTGIMVKDINTSISFYEEVLGMKLKDRITHTNGVIELAFLGFQDGPETEIELIQGYSSELPSEGKVHHIALLTDDIAAEFTKAQRMEATFIDEEITTLPNGYRYFYIEGPDREWIEFFQR